MISELHNFIVLCEFSFLLDITINRTDFFFFFLFHLLQFLCCSADNDTSQGLLIKDKIKSLSVQNFLQE